MSSDDENTILFLDAVSKLRLANVLYDIDRIQGLNDGRLGMLQLCGTDHVSLLELAAISDHIYPLALSHVIMDADFHISVSVVSA